VKKYSLKTNPVYYNNYSHTQKGSEKKGSIYLKISTINLLPEDTGDPFGDTVVEERKIRITRFPGQINDDSDE